METFISLYLIVGIFVSSCICGAAFDQFSMKKERWFSKPVMFLGKSLFFVMMMICWPMVVMYMAPAFFKK